MEGFTGVFHHGIHSQICISLLMGLSEIPLPQLRRLVRSTGSIPPNKKTYQQVSTSGLRLSSCQFQPLGALQLQLPVHEWHACTCQGR